VELIVAILALVGLAVAAELGGYDSRERSLVERAERARWAFRDGDVATYQVEIAALEREMVHSSDREPAPAGETRRAPRGGRATKAIARRGEG
jgi:hypothetical protein